MIDIAGQLRRFLRGRETLRLAQACFSFWSQIETWLRIALEQKDIETCHPSMLAVHGWSRRVERLPDEPLELYRKRVLHAYANAEGAGYRKGLEEILTRLGIADYSIAEREPGKDPDICSIHLQSGTLTQKNELLVRIFQEYGLTCRRYSMTVADFCGNYAAAGEYAHRHQTDAAHTGNRTLADTAAVSSATRVAEFSDSQQTYALGQ